MEDNIGSIIENDTSSIEQEEEREASRRLHILLDKNDIEKLMHIFNDAKEQKFAPDELREVLKGFNIHFSDEEFETLFLKVNTDRDNMCEWDEFISYLILGFEEDDPYNQKATLTMPISRSPTIRRAIHRHNIIRITLCPTVLPDRSTDVAKGTYVTTSKDGTVNFWSLDLEFQRSDRSKSPFLKIAQTWILDSVCLPDVRIICTSSTERDLRFYDTTANNFSLRIVITSLPFAVSTMHYYFNQSVAINSRLLLGDFGGNVQTIEFNTELRGPFQSKTGTALIQLTYSELIKGKFPLMRVKEYNGYFVDIVRQVEFVESLNCIIACAECPMASGNNVQPGLVMLDLSLQQNVTIIKASKGMTCFAYDAFSNCLATGGLDCLLRLWNPIVPKKPIAILPGHHAGIIYIFLQDNGKKVYSMDKNKIIKVWEVLEQNLLQTYIMLASAIVDRSPVVCHYNDSTRELIAAGMKIAVMSCCPLLKLELTDGDTHSRAVSVVLYNRLFNYVITCGQDSIIIVWDPWTGKRLTLIKNAHTRMVYGEVLRVEITAACFDPKHQLLLTGARNGTLKVWNFNNGVCVRNLAIEKMCEVTAVFWVKNRMLAVGWNRHVTEFADSGETEYGNSKYWDTCHMEDVLCAASREPQTLATSSYSGEVVLWKLETGQPYRKYSVDYPTKRVKIIYDGQKIRLQKTPKYASSLSKYTQNSTAQSEIKQPPIDVGIHKPVVTSKNRSRYLSIIQMPAASAILRPLAVQALIFLDKRPMTVNHGTLIVSLENGMIQIYSHHQLGSYITQFNAIHMPGDCIITMATDVDNKYLFTATAHGYIKSWLMTNYCIPEEEYVHINMPLLRFTFPFLIKDKFLGRAKRSVKSQPLPLLINSYKAHVRAILKIEYIDKTAILLSASSDKSVRLWTVGGRYLGTLGTPVPWIKLSSSTPPSRNHPFRIPPDIKRIGSSTTLKVLKGGLGQANWLTMQLLNKKAEETPVVINEKNICVYGVQLRDPILGKHFELPPRNQPYLKPVLDKSLPYIPVYSHLDVQPAKVVERPKTPEVLKNIKNLNFVLEPKQFD